MDTPHGKVDQLVPEEAIRLVVIAETESLALAKRQM